MNPFPHSPNRYCRGKAESGLLGLLAFLFMWFLAGLLFGEGPLKNCNAWMPETFWSYKTKQRLRPSAEVPDLLSIEHLNSLMKK
jgi:hypothetical protein